MTDPSSHVEVELHDMIKLYGDIEEYLICLDRILSRIDFGGDPKILYDYVVDRQLFKRIAHSREVLGNSLAQVIGESEVEVIAENIYKYTD